MLTAQASVSMSWINTVLAAAERHGLTRTQLLAHAGLGAQQLTDERWPIDDITRLFTSGRKAEAVAAVPDELVEETAIIGSVEHVRATARRWEAVGVTSLVVTCGDAARVKALGDALVSDE